MTVTGDDSLLSWEDRDGWDPHDYDPGTALAINIVGMAQMLITILLNGTIAFAAIRAQLGYNAANMLSISLCVTYVFYGTFVLTSKTAMVIQGEWTLLNCRIDANLNVFFLSAILGIMLATAIERYLSIVPMKKLDSIHVYQALGLAYGVGVVNSSVHAAALPRPVISTSGAFCFPNFGSQRPLASWLSLFNVLAATCYVIVIIGVYSSIIRYLRTTFRILQTRSSLKLFGSQATPLRSAGMGKSNGSTLSDTASGEPASATAMIAPLPPPPPVPNDAVQVQVTAPRRASASPPASPVDEESASHHERRTVSDAHRLKTEPAAATVAPSSRRLSRVIAAGVPRPISGRFAPLARGLPSAASSQSTSPTATVLPPPPTLPRREARIFRYLPLALRALDSEGLGGSHSVSMTASASTRRQSHGAGAGGGAEPSVLGDGSEEVTIGSSVEVSTFADARKRSSGAGITKQKESLKALRVEAHLLRRGLAVFLSFILTWVLFVLKVVLTYATKRRLGIAFDAATSVALLTCPIIDPLLFLLLDRGFRKAFVKEIPWPRLLWRRRSK
ncbi:hypothetical protein H9P43_004235 [Blastocladiella emersonii ATCC 22665]|nr:hypothetical protein H9P43_004235 [Blastocladiella emersonii ATCC 22665]